MNVASLCHMACRSKPKARFLRALALLLLGITVIPLPVQAGAGPDQWVETWGQAMVSHVQPSPENGAYHAPHLHDATLRQTVRISIGGKQLRVRLSNVYGLTPLTVAAASVAAAADIRDHTAIDPGRSHALSFGGKPTLTIAAGTTALSDPVTLLTPALSNLVVNLYFRDDAVLADYHPAESAATTAVVAGNALQATSLASRPAIATLGKDFASHIYVVEGVEIAAARATRGIVAFGDSITDGAYASAPDKPWPAVLATLANRVGAVGAAVINTGISGNELTIDQPDHLEYGPAALKRFERDVIDRAGVTDVIVLLGTNDLNRGADAAGQPRGALAHDIIDGLRLLADAAHAHHLRIHAGTIPPFAGFPAAGWYSPAKEAIRQGINRWIRHTGVFDSVMDFSRALAGPYQPSPLAARQQPLPPGLATTCAGDAGLHPNDHGYAVMGTLAYNVLFHAQEQPAERCH